MENTCRTFSILLLPIVCNYSLSEVGIIINFNSRCVDGIGLTQQVKASYLYGCMTDAFLAHSFSREIIPRGWPKAGIAHNTAATWKLGTKMKKQDS